jgi:membrane protein DedA with SNARE-associated domain
VFDRENRVRDVCLAVTALLTVAGTLGTAFSPYLLVEMPLVLVALSADVRHLVLVAANTDFLPVLIVGVPRRALGMATMYGLGLTYGQPMLGMLEEKAPRLGGALRWCERLLARRGSFILVVAPAYTFGALAGIARLKARWFIPAMLIGQAVYITAGYFFGEQLRSFTVPLLAFVTEHLVASTAVCVAFVAVLQIGSKLRKRGSE